MTSNDNRNCIAGAVRMGFGCGNCAACIEETKFILNGMQKKLEYAENELEELNACFKLFPRYCED